MLTNADLAARLRISVMPNLAVLIPAYNESKTIRRAIFSCYAAGMQPADVYVANDGSKDHTATLAVSLSAQVVSLTNGGKALAIHRGLLHFNLFDRYEWVTILDADCVMAPGYVRSLRQTIEREPTAALISGVELSPRLNWLTAWRAVEHAIFGGVYREAQHFAHAIIVVPGLCSTFRTAVLRTLEFGNGTIIEDMDWTIQLHRRGERVLFDPDAHVTAQQPATIRDYIKQITRWHLGTWQNIRLHQIGSRMQPIDFALSETVIEALIYGAALLLLPAIWWSWGGSYVRWGFVIDQAILGTYTLLVAVRERRTDVLWAFPLFSIPRALNIWSFVRAFFLERQSQALTGGAWVSPSRY